MRRFTLSAALVAAALTLLALPVASIGQPNIVQKLLGGVDKTTRDLGSNVQRLAPQKQSGAAQGVKPRGAAPGSPGGYNPPLHGTNPHGQGTVATVDLPASSQRPLPADPAGGNGEVIVVGRARGEQRPGGDNGTHKGHITIAALFGNEILGVDTDEGETAAGPLDMIQTGLLNAICNGSQQNVCLEVLAADSSTNNSGSTNRFAVATAKVGPGASILNAGVAESRGNVSEDANCQSSFGFSNVADARALNAISADVIESSSSSRRCSDGSGSQTNTSKVVNLQNAGLAVPAPGCANGTPNTGPLLLPPVASAICNANESNAGQAGVNYGVREGLTAFALGTLLKATTSASESRAIASAEGPGTNPPGGGGSGDGSGDGSGNAGDEGSGGNGGNGDDGDGNGGTAGAGGGNPACSDGIDNDGDGKTDFPNDPGCASSQDRSEGNGAGAGNGNPQCSDGIDNDGDGKVDFPDDPQCSSASDDSEADSRLALTGTNLLFTFLIGALVLLVGLRLRELTGRLERGQAV